MTIFKSLLIPTCLLGVLTLLSCSDNPAVRLRYEAERRLHTAEKALGEAQAFQRFSPGQAFQIAGDYNDLAEFLFDALDEVDPKQYPVEYHELVFLEHETTMRLAGLLYTAGKFDSSAVVISRLVADVPLEEHLLMSSYVELGKTMQASGKWDSALTIYNHAVDNFAPPLDPVGNIVFDVFNLPLHVFRMVTLLGDKDAAAYEFNRAEIYYLNFLNESGPDRLALSSRANLSLLYDDVGQWEKELAQLKALADPAHPSYLTVQLKIADIYGSELHRFDTALALYDDVMKRIDPEDDEALAGVLFKIGLVRMEQEDYNEARNILKRLKNDYGDFYARTPLAQYTLARSFEFDKRWNRAEQEYGLLIEKYRGSSEAMATLIYLFDHYRKEKRDREAQAWFDRALNHFDRLITTNAGTPLEARALLYKADLYGRSDRWEQAADILLSIFNKFPTSKPGRQAGLKAADIHKNQLDNPQKADSLMAVLRTRLAEIEQGPQVADPFAND